MHIPVLVREVVDELDPKKEGIYIDATYGAGGYTKAIQERTACHIIGFDRDPHVRPSDIEFYNVPFSHIAQCVKNPVDGVVFDFGVSSMQIDDPSRGFSFQKEGPLDMRMSQDGLLASDVVNTFSESDLTQIIETYGEEPKARKISKAIVMHRPFYTTKDLARIIESIVPRKKIHPATKTFQALRIFVNDELREIQNGLQAAYTVLKQGGKIVTVSFHALEDRVIKDFVRTHKDMTMTQKLKPSRQEIRINPRSRSATLRVLVKA